LLAINVSQMHDKLGCWFDGRVIGSCLWPRISGCSDPTRNLVRPRFGWWKV